MEQNKFEDRSFSCTYSSADRSIDKLGEEEKEEEEEERVPE